MPELTSPTFSGEDCTDLGLVDLPGFRRTVSLDIGNSSSTEKLRPCRSYAKDDAMQQLAKKIDTLVFKFMLGSQWFCQFAMHFCYMKCHSIPMKMGQKKRAKGWRRSCNTILCQNTCWIWRNDENNIMLCVEEAGDAAGREFLVKLFLCHESIANQHPVWKLTGFATLGKAKQVDPSYKRTILIRNKLDKCLLTWEALIWNSYSRWVWGQVLEKGWGVLPAPQVLWRLDHWKCEQMALNLVDPVQWMRKTTAKIYGCWTKNRGCFPPPKMDDLKWKTL